MNSSTFFLTFLLFFNINLIKCDETNDEAETQVSRIDVDLKNIKKGDFDILTSVEEFDPTYENKLESYKLTPKANKKIDKIAFGQTNVWDTEVSTECSSITVYNHEHVFFILKTPFRGVTNYVHLKLKDGSLKYTGVLNLLYEINYESLFKIANKPQVLNISNKFDKLYFKHLYKQKNGYRYETFEPNEGEVFVEITDGSDSIWKMAEIGVNPCKKVRVFVQEVTSLDTKTGNLNNKMVPLFMSFVLFDDSTYHRKFNIYTKKWEEITSIDFGTGIDKFIDYRINSFSSGETSSSDDDSDKNLPNTLDIFKRNESINYAAMNLLSVRLIHLSPADNSTLNKIVYNDQAFLETDSLEFEINLVSCSDNWYYVEISIKSDTDLTKDEKFSGLVITRVATNLYTLYYQISLKDKKSANITRLRFLEIVMREVYNSDEPGYIKFTDVYGLRDGSHTSDLSEAIRLKINPDYVKESDEVVPEPPAETNDTAGEGNTDDPAKPEDPIKTDDPAKPEDSDSSEGDGNTDDPSNPKDDVEPEDPIKPDDPARPEDTSDSPLTTDDPAKPDDPARPEDEAEAGGKKDDNKVNPETSSSESEQLSEKKNDITKPSGDSLSVVVVQKVVKFFNFLGIGPGIEENEDENKLRIGSKKSGYISNISTASILIIISAILI